MRHVLVLSLLLGSAGVSACFTGPSAAGFPPAITPHGVASRIRLRRSVVRGELLEVRDTAYVVLGDDALLLLPFDAIGNADFDGVLSVAGAPGSAASERLRLVSRYPQGMSPRVLESLLAAVHQSELRVVRE